MQALPEVNARTPRATPRGGTPRGTPRGGTPRGTPSPRRAAGRSPRRQKTPTQGGRLPGGTKNSDPIARYFRGRVHSTPRFVAGGGRVLAMPFPQTGRSKTPDAMGGRVVGSHTEYRERFKVLPHCFSSMDAKPLEPYAEGALRSRNAIPDPAIPHKNASCLDFDGGISVCHQRAYTTTSQLYLTGESEDPRTNPGILADASRFRRQMLRR